MSCIPAKTPRIHFPDSISVPSVIHRCAFASSPVCGVLRTTQRLLRCGPRAASGMSARQAGLDAEILRL